MSRTWIWVSIVLLVGGGIGFFLLRSGTGQAQRETNPIEAGDKVTEGDDPLQRQLEQLRLAVIGSDAKLVDAGASTAGWMVGMEIDAQGLQLANFLDDAMGLFRELDRADVPIEQATLVFRSDKLKDVYGNQLQDVVVARLRLDGETFHRINWHGFKPPNFSRVADELWVHDQVEPLERGGQDAGGGGDESSGGEDGGGGGGGDGGGDSGGE